MAIQLVVLEALLVVLEALLAAFEEQGVVLVACPGRPAAAARSSARSPCSSALGSRSSAGLSLIHISEPTRPEPI
eukprot:1393484-Pyramimonas_sp.AAC.1